MTRIAVLADIHGNLPALDAVIADLASVRVDAVWNLGDCLSGPLWPRETAERLMGLGWVHVRGNHDRQVAAGVPETMGLSDAFAYSEITAVQRAWLSELPSTHTWEDQLLAFHGSPDSDNEFLLEETAGGRKVLRPQADVARLSAGCAQAVLLCGHSHVPGWVQLGSGQRILNPGSVGLQAYGEEDYRVETGSPHARYAILHRSAAGWAPEFRLVAYDWNAAARRAQAGGRPDWATALATGYYGTI